MSWTFDTSNDIGKVRALCGDVDPALVFLSDEEIQVFIDEETQADGTVIRKLAAASALMAMAAKHAIILKKVDMLDLKLDGPAVAESLRRMAKEYRDQVNEKLEVENEGFFEFASAIKTPYHWTANVWGLPDTYVNEDYFEGTE